mmetsp:Transcript_50199/g.121634  ORF Transcript_50199/g.121634 Transcript_50199/m.121634 type:complete len:245 (+) Transcript_50199:706-1440(+)
MRREEGGFFGAVSLPFSFRESTMTSSSSELVSLRSQSLLVITLLPSPSIMFDNGRSWSVDCAGRTIATIALSSLSLLSSSSFDLEFLSLADLEPRLLELCDFFVVVFFFFLPPFFSSPAGSTIVFLDFCFAAFIFAPPDPSVKFLLELSFSLSPPVLDSSFLCFFFVVFLGDKPPPSSPFDGLADLDSFGNFFVFFIFCLWDLSSLSVSSDTSSIVLPIIAVTTSSFFPFTGVVSIRSLEDIDS